MSNRFRSSAIALALSLFASACSDASQASEDGWEWSGPVGSLGLQLQLAPDVVLSSIEYEITGQGFTKTGSIPVPGTGTTFVATIAEIPVGTGHVIKLRSLAAGDAGLACAGQATFSVVASSTTQVQVVLSCDGVDVGGSAAINGSFNICPSVTATTLSPTVQAIGGSIAVSLSARDVDQAPQALSYSWATNTGTLSNATTSAPSLLCTQAGPVALTYTLRDGACVKTGTLNATCGGGAVDAGAPVDSGVDSGTPIDSGVDAGPGNPANIVINEVESSGGAVVDYIELYNKGAQEVDVSGWILKDNDDTHSLALPANTKIAAGGYLVVDTDPPFGLGGADSARLYVGTTLLDSFSWPSHASGTYGRCPNGLGAFADGLPTRGSANACDSTPDAGTPDAGSELAWPGSANVTEVDVANTWPENLSGLAYQAGSPNVIWGVLNNPSKLFKLIASGSLWVNSPGEWSAGKTLVYPSGSGVPDSEGITIGADGSLYVSTERDNSVGASKLSVLQFVDAAGTTLTATREWNLTADLPAVGPHLGLEAIAFIPDSELVGFKEDSGSPYNQARYAQNGGGVFAVGVEGGGAIYLYALDHSAASGFTKLATIPSGFGGVMELAYDPETNYLWAWADNDYGNKAALFELEPSMVSTSYGKFVKRKVLNRPAGPTGLPLAGNNEGFTFAPDSQCTGGFRAVFWADDSNTNSHALRQGALTCGKSY
ncbi:MAG TPA: lamin tail domain-containing protein [Polyangiales bacterium]|nr:lamin tail domain-containing protein [Polyangiales bacterium]